MTTTFRQLFENQLYDRVEIPIIQRDYAQGRSDQRIVRDEFLRVLHKALCPSKEALDQRIDLDFVYGSVENGSFQPLDGQQRLTTLFLLHWYLAWVDECFEEFQAVFVTKGRSRFGYEVRSSSREFIDAFAGFKPKVSAMSCLNIQKLISDQPWFFRSWQFDPTIQSSLMMLEQMHKVFRNTTGLYARLIDKATPAITFQLLHLEQFGLSDDLYIKMNARGKLLTPFETFKARFEQDLKKCEFAKLLPTRCGDTPISKFFARRIDQQWSDFFWSYRDERTATFDDAVMNLVRVVITVTRASNNDSTNNDLADLRNATIESNYAWFHENSWLDQEMIIALITLLERWSAGQDSSFKCYLPAGTRHIDEEELFEKIIRQPKNLIYEELVQLAGYVQYIVRADCRKIDSTVFNGWMRIVVNLSANTYYNEPNDLRLSISSLNELLPQMDDITRFLAGPAGHVRHFWRYQVAEERIKAHLLGFGGDWPERIYRVEQYRYFQGQIGFLLCFCDVDLGNPNEELVRINAEVADSLAAPFEYYNACAVKMFDDLKNSPDESGRLWERALLSVGDYLLTVRQNKSLLTLDMDRDRSWKRLLRNASSKESSQGQVLKELWDQLKSPASFETDLVKIVEPNPNIDPWRTAIVATPDVFNYSDSRMMRFSDDGGIYLLKKMQMNGEHVELFTYCVFKELEVLAEPLSLKIASRPENSTDVEPGLSLSQRLGLNDVTFHLERSWRSADGYELYLNEPKEPDSDLREILEDDGFETEEGGYLTKRVSRADIKVAVLSLDRLLM